MISRLFLWPTSAVTTMMMMMMMIMMMMMMMMSTSVPHDSVNLNAQCSEVAGQEE